MKKFPISIVLLLFIILIACFCGCKTQTLDNNYNITFVIDGETYFTDVAEFGKTVSKPEINVRGGYVFKGWYISDEYIEKWNFETNTVKDNITLYAYWLPEAQNSFNVLFYDEYAHLTKYEKVPAGTCASDYTPPAKTGYNFLGWFFYNAPFDFSVAVYDDITLNAKWEAINYCLEFVSDGNTVKKCYFSVENHIIDEPEVPQKQHYNGEWENYTLAFKDMQVNAVYTPVIYSATFIVDDNIFKQIEYTIEDTVTTPLIPEKAGYTSEWLGLPVNGGNVTVTAVYTPIVYTAYFVVSEEIIESINYTVENTDIVFPAVPDRLGFEGSWEKINLGTENVYFNASYLLKNYKVTFIVDNQTIATEFYNIEEMEITVPEIPPKSGFTATWEEFDLNELRDITVNAIYNPME